MVTATREKPSPLPTLEIECMNCGNDIKVVEEIYGYKTECPECGKLNVRDTNLGIKRTFDGETEYKEFLENLEGRHRLVSQDSKDFHRKEREAVNYPNP